jgi:hypothetical protein
MVYIVPGNRTLWKLVDEGNEGDGLRGKGQEAKILQDNIGLL